MLNRFSFAFFQSVGLPDTGWGCASRRTYGAVVGDVAAAISGLDEAERMPASRGRTESGGFKPCGATAPPGRLCAPGPEPPAVLQQRSATKRGTADRNPGLTLGSACPAGAATERRLHVVNHRSRQPVKFTPRCQADFINGSQTRNIPSRRQTQISSPRRRGRIVKDLTPDPRCPSRNIAST
jgi:hypothetical protein